MPWLWIVIAISIAAPVRAAEAQPAPGSAAEVPSARFTDADALLLALERGDEGLQTFEADIEYDRRFELQGDQHVRRGHIYYKVIPTPAGGSGKRAVFAVRFNQFQIEETVRTEEQTLVFDGQWLIEKTEASKRFIKRQVALPGEEINPLRLGEGPFPIPIGQKRDDIVARYEARLAPATESIEDESHLNGEFTAGTTQIVLTPRPEFSRDEFREIRLWYRPEGDARLLPRLARTVNRQGDVTLVRLVGMRVNAADFPASIVDVAEPPKGDGWDVQVELKRAGASGQSPE